MNQRYMLDSSSEQWPNGMQINQIKSSSWNTLYHHISQFELACTALWLVNWMGYISSYSLLNLEVALTCLDLNLPPSIWTRTFNHNTYLTTLVSLLCTASYRTMLFQLRFKAHMLNRAWAIYPSGKNLVCILATQKANLTAKSYL